MFHVYLEFLSIKGVVLIPTFIAAGIQALTATAISTHSPNKQDNLNADKKSQRPSTIPFVKKPKSAAIFCPSCTSVMESQAAELLKNINDEILVYEKVLAQLAELPVDVKGEEGLTSLVQQDKNLNQEKSLDDKCKNNNKLSEEQSVVSQRAADSRDTDVVRYRQHEGSHNPFLLGGYLCRGDFNSGAGLLCEEKMEEPTTDVKDANAAKEAKDNKIGARSAAQVLKLESLISTRQVCVLKESVLHNLTRCKYIESNIMFVFYLVG